MPLDIDPAIVTYLQVGPGSLYPALHKLEKEGWVEAEWSVNETKRRVKFYSITKEGRKRLQQEAADWKRLSGAVSSCVKPEVGYATLTTISIADKLAVKAFEG